MISLAQKYPAQVVIRLLGMMIWVLFLLTVLGFPMLGNDEI